MFKVFAFDFETCTKTISLLISLSVGVSRLWCTGVVFMQPAMKMNGEYYCDVLLLKQLLPHICQAAGDFYFPAHHTCARAPSSCDKTPDFTLGAWPSKFTTDQTSIL